MFDDEKEVVQSALDSKELYFKPISLSLDVDFANYLGIFDIAQVMHGKSKTFRIPKKQAGEEKKRIIVLSDCSFRSSTTLSTELLRKTTPEFIENLIQKGFDVRFWNGKQTVKISDAKELRKQFGIQAAQEQKVIDVLAKEDINKEAILHLDYFKLRKLLQYYIPYNTLVLEDFKDFEEIPPDIDQWLRNKKFSILAWSSEDNRMLKLFIERFPEEIIGIELHGVSDISLLGEIEKLQNLEDLFWAESSYVTQDEKLEIKKAWENFEKSRKKPLVFKKLRNLVLQFSDIPSTLVSELLEHTNHLQKIDLLRCSNLNNLKLNSNKSYQSLEILRINGKQCNPYIFEPLITNAFFLKELEIKKVDLVKYNNSWSTRIGFQPLKNNHDFMQEIIQRATNLERLNISKCEGLTPCRTIGEQSQFRKLKSLAISRVSFEVCASIISHAPLLENLTLKSLRRSKILTRIEEISLDKIETIEIDDSSITEKKSFLYDLILKANNLKKITLSQVSLDIEVSFRTTYPKLEEISFVASTIPFEFYQQLFQEGGQLEKIAIKDCDMSSGLFTKERFQKSRFDKLKEIYIESSKFDSDLLNHMIAKSKSLQKLHIDILKRINNPFEELINNSMPFISLTRLELFNQNLSPDFLKNIPFLFPNLETLIINQCRGLKLGNSTLGDGTLPALTTLKIVESDIDEIGVRELLLARKNLRKVTLKELSSLKMLKFSDVEKSKLSKKLRIIDIAFSAIKSVPDIETNTIKWLFEENPCLNELKIANCVFEKNVKLNHLQLSNLTILHLTNLAMDHQLFFTLLKATPELKEITINASAITHFTVEDIPDDLKLSDLERFTLIETKFSTTVVEKLEACAPKLRAIDIRETSKSSRTRTEERNTSGEDPKPSFWSSFWGNNRASAKSATKSTSVNSQERSSRINTSTSTSYEIHAGDEPKPRTKRQLQTKEFFIPSISPLKYRLVIYDKVILDGEKIILKQSENKTFIQEKISHAESQESLFTEFSKYQKKEIPNKDDAFPRYVLCTRKLVITDEWQALPSLSVNELLLQVFCDHPHYEIQYSTADNLYYIREQDGKGKGKKATLQPSEIYFILDTQGRRKKQKQPFPKGIQKLIDYCKAFHEDYEGVLKFPENITAETILDKRYRSQIGSCLYRSIVFHYKFQKLLQINPSVYKNYRCRIVIIPGVHAFVEIFDGHSWDKVDLDGYDSELTIEKIDDSDLELIRSASRKKSPVLEQEKPDSNIDTTAQVTIQKVITEADLRPELMPWKETPEEKIPPTRDELFQILIQPGQKNLLRLQEPDDCLKIVAAFSTSAFKKPYLFLDAADDLQWKASGLKFCEDNKYLKNYPLAIQKAFSKLRYFLDTYPDGDGVLFINCSNFSATEIATLHTFLDENILEGECFSLRLPIISFYCDKIPNACQVTDFKTPQHSIYTWNYPLHDIALYSGRSKETKAAPSKDILTIDLFASDDWESLLLGAIQIEAQRFSFAPSSFLKNLEMGENSEIRPLKALHLINPLWHLREFQLFWQNALQQGFFSLYGKTFHLEKGFQLTYSSDTAIKTTVVQKNLNEKKSETFTYPLNSHTFHEFFTHYEFQQDKLDQGNFVSRSGLLQQHPALTLVVTEDLPKNQWRRLLIEAQKLSEDKPHETTLYLQLADGVKLPEELTSVPYENFSPRLFDLTRDFVDLAEKPFAVLFSKGARARIEIAEAFLDQHPDAIYISLDSTHDFSDLFYQIHPTLTDAGILARFIESDPWKALQAGKTVIIEGSLPQALINALSSLLISEQSELIINGQVMPFKGKLFIVTDTVIPFTQNRFYCPEKPEDVKNIFKQTILENQDVVPAKENVTAAVNLISSEKPQAPLNPKAPDDDFHDLSFEAFKAYEDRRFAKILQGFAQSPILAYLGPTGIGKSTYLLTEFAADYLERTGQKIHLYIGEEQIESFAAHYQNPDNVDIQPILFIDEANLSKQKLSFLKSLKSKKSHLLRNGHYYDYSPTEDFTPEPKVILAGNPKTYGGVRHQQEFFDQYAAPVEAERPNHAYLYHKILKPQLDKNTIEKNCEAIAKVLLTVFDKVNQVAKTTDPLLSPRHLHMMVVLFNAYSQQFKEEKITPEHLAIAAGLTILGDSSSESKRRTLLRFLIENYRYDEKKFVDLRNKTIEATIAELKTNSIAVPFTFTPSRCSFLHTLDTFLSIRTDENFHFGLLLEGNSGIGKSELVKNYLRLKGIEFISFTPSNNYETGRDILLKAFREGTIVVIKNMNAGGQRIEKLINTLMMGTDEDGNKPNKKGFMVIATQNPISMSGRLPLSPAMKARFILTNMLGYPVPELVSILEGWGVGRDAAETWAKDFTLSSTYADDHHLDLKPNLRHLKKAAGVLECDKEELSIEDEGKEKTCHF